MKSADGLPAAATIATDKQTPLRRRPEALADFMNSNP
jgi:hypothetical protein